MCSRTSEVRLQQTVCGCCESWLDINLPKTPPCNLNWLAHLNGRLEYLIHVVALGGSSKRKLNDNVWKIKIYCLLVFSQQQLGGSSLFFLNVQEVSESVASKWMIACHGTTTRFRCQKCPSLAKTMIFNVWTEDCCLVRRTFQRT